MKIHADAKLGPNRGLDAAGDLLVRAARPEARRPKAN